MHLGFSSSEPSLPHGYCQMCMQNVSTVYMQFSAVLKLHPPETLLQLLYYDSPSPPHRTHHTYIHICTPHPPTAPLYPQANHAHWLINVKTTQSGADQTGNGFIIQHVALSFVWRDPTVISDGMWVNPDVCKEQRPTLSPLLRLWFHVVYNQTFQHCGKVHEDSDYIVMITVITVS